MSLAILQNVDRAVIGAGNYVKHFVDKISSAIDVVMEVPVAEELPIGPDRSIAPSDATSILDLPIDLVRKVWAYLDADTLAGVVPLVCKAWSEEVARPALWQERLPSKLMEQMPALAELGAPVSTAHLFLALRGRNFLRNPAFRRDCNTAGLLDLGGLSWSKWKRDAWVIGHATKHGVCWEEQPDGFSGPSAWGAHAPPPPVPYSGGTGSGLRLGMRMQQQLRGLLGGLAPKEAAPQAERSSSCSSQSAAAATAAAAPPPSCVTTTADWCEVMQVVDLPSELLRRGLSGAQAAHLLDSGLGLRLSVHVGSRSDCLGQFCVGLMLDEGGAGGEVPQMQSFVMRPSRHCYFSGRVRCEGAGAWQRFEYQVPVVPRGCRRALVLLRGRRAGGAPAVREQLPTPTVYCGAKFACAELVFE